MDAHIEPEAAQDVPAIREVILAAFTDQPEVADLVAAIRASPHYEPDLSLVARLDGRVVGYVMVSHAGIVADAPAGVVHDVLTLSPLAVSPDHQRRGIGSALVRAALAAAGRTDAPLVVLEGDPAYYGRFGFLPAGDSGITMRLPDWAPPEAAQIFRLPGCRAAIRGRVVYPPAFDAVT